MTNRRCILLILAALALAALLGPGQSSAHLLNPVDCYALLVVAANDTNAGLHSHLDPIDVNGAEVALSRVYAALKEARFDDSHIIVLYCSGGLQPDWSEKKNAKYFKMLRKKHFKRANYDATKANIQSAVNSLKKKLDDNDQFVFWIVTHGAANGTLILPRGNWRTSEFQSTFAGLKSQTNYILIDSCYSGRILDSVTIENALMVSATGSSTPGWVDRNFSNCAYMLECKNNKSLDRNKDGVVDYREAFDETKSSARKYEPKLKEYTRTKYKPNRPVPRALVEKFSIIPKLKVGSRFAKSNLGPPGSAQEQAVGQEKKMPKGKRRTRRPRRKVDPGKALMRKAKLYESGKGWVSAIDAYKKVAGMGENSRYSKEAVRKRDKLLSNKKIAAEYEAAQLEKQLDEDLTMAESYVLAGEYDEAIGYCEKVIKAAPNSRQAKSARSLLEYVREVKRLER